MSQMYVPANWSSARDHCERLGKTLLRITTSGKETSVEAQISADGSNK